MSIVPEGQYDVAIIGGGVSGCAAAIMLLRQGASVCIIEKSKFETPRIGETIPPDANLLIEKLGLRDAFSAQNHLRCNGGHSVWGSKQLGHNDFMFSPYGHGWHLDRSAFDAMMLQEAVNAGAKLFDDKCTRVSSNEDSVTKLTVPTGDILATIYLDATGRKGLLTRSMKSSRRVDDRQTVIWARFKAEAQTLGNSTWLEAASYGWWYAAAVPGDQVVVALGSDPVLSKKQGLYHIQNWAQALTGTDYIAPSLSRAQLIQNSFQTTASYSFISMRTSGENWMAIGDAATSLDPLSSAGIFKGLQSGILAAEAVGINNWNKSCKIYDERTKTDYETYLNLRNELYDLEQRWPDAPFWKARHNSMSVVDVNYTVSI